MHTFLDDFFRVHRHVIRVIPVALGVVESNRHTSFVAGIDDLSGQITAKWRIGYLELRFCGVPHVKTVVVLGDKNYVFEVGFPGNADPLPGIKLLQPELI